MKALFLYFYARHLQRRADRLLRDIRASRFNATQEHMDAYSDAAHAARNARKYL